MQTLGERLEEARKRKGISIREAAEATKIRGDYLQKFEANTFDLDLPPLYVRGFVRAYARYLELDAQRFLSEYDAAMAGEGRAPRRETRENYGRVEVGGGDGESTGGGSLDPVMLKYIIYGSAAVVLTIVVLLLVNLLSGGSEPRSTSPKQRTESVPAPTGQQTANPATAADSVLTVTIAEPTRVRIIYADNSVVFLDGKYPMNAGESRTLSYSKELFVMAEHPDRIRLEINGEAVQIPDDVKPLSYFRVPVIPRR